MSVQVYLILHDNTRVLLGKKKDYPAWYNDRCYGTKPKNIREVVIENQPYSFYVGGVNLKKIDPDAYIIPGGKSKTKNYISEGYQKFYSETGINLTDHEILNTQQVEFREASRKFYGIYVHVSETTFNICYEIGSSKLMDAENFRNHIEERVEEYERGNFANLPPVCSNQLSEIYSVEINLIKNDKNFFTKCNNWYDRMIHYL